MEKTQVMVNFSLYGDVFPLDYVTDKLGLQPTHSYNKGDLIPNYSTALYKKETSWDLETGYEESLNTEIQLQRILKSLLNKSSSIIELKNMYSLDCKFSIVIIVEEGETPAFYLSKEFIKFASLIEAEIDIDLYANPYESNY
ncbi:DUF4279 domain-containing protein [Bacillus mangrovi]|uniref:DUF4279 domain-containing protein n=1 Tax=Metabacillus mangrovi TaxID=1491830 RepID=A0A7X2S8P9_9BACI|nr:DUF4279 domain-containing protein [Metabacillus mangrovi]MTH55343.1 DUF4279 domain-containing protein [Metabacillus mangrovi]